MINIKGQWVFRLQGGRTLKAFPATQLPKCLRWAREFVKRHKEVKVVFHRPTGAVSFIKVYRDGKPVEDQPESTSAVLGQTKKPHGLTKLEPSAPTYPVVDCPRHWDQGSREERVDGLGKRRWKVTDLREAVKDCPVYEVPLAFLDLAAHQMKQEGGLIDFATHMKHVMEADLSYPIIFDQWGQILDGRHRIVKALVEGHATIKAVKVPDGTQPTFWAE